MRFTVSILFAAMIMLGFFGGPAGAWERAAIGAYTEGMETKTGLLTLHLDHDKGRVLLELPAGDADSGLIGRYLYTPYLGAGLGSNPVGLDRNAGGNTQLIAIRRIGGHIVIEAENHRYRATSSDEGERNAVRQSFATSILWAGKIVAEGGDGEVLVDFSDFLTGDAIGVAQRLKNAGQGSFKLDAARSLVNPRAALVFPENLELEAVLTFASSEPGPEVRATTPDPRSITLTVHHSIIKLPDEAYRTRLADPRSGGIETGYADYSAAIDAPVKVRLARRFRLEKTDPGAARSRVKKPIVFYIDHGAPEPIRSALVEGAGWWAEAFEAAGFIDGYRVEVLPADIHPLDARYNVVHWVHRASRGWSYGGAVADPRTGEVVRGYVLLGSLRVRQDRMIFEGLAGVGNVGKGGPNDPVEVALSRIRQLAAHEVGHSLGLLHNMAASTYGGRASVMDYPAPEITITEDGGLDFTGAYGVGVGVWDKYAITYLYRQFAEDADEKAELTQLVETAIKDGLVYVADSDARPSDAAHPRGNLWDTGTEPVASLIHTMAVRRIALDNFGLGNIADGARVSDLQTVIVPIYLFHRYQLNAAVKVVGGLEFTYGIKGDGQRPMATLDPAYQGQALAAVLDTIEPAALDLPNRVLEVLSPVHRGFGDAKFPREAFKGQAFPVFDLLGAADVAAGQTIRALLHPARAGRLVEFHRRDGDNPSFESVLQEITRRVFASDDSEPEREVEIRWVVQARLISSLIELALSEDAMPAVVNRVEAHLEGLRDAFAQSRGGGALRRGHENRLLATINRHLERPAEAAVTRTVPKTPPGSPIGSEAHYCWHCEVY